MIKDIKDKYFKKLYIANSQTAGQGLFAGESINAGDLILIFGGTLLSSHSRYSGEYLRSTCIGISEEFLLGESVKSQKDYSDYINHSCKPNAGMQDAITLVAIRDIKENEEIFVDYAFWESNNEWIMKVPCVCGNDNCRQTITGKDWVNVKTTDPLFEFYSPFIRRRIKEHEKGKT